MRIAVGSKNRVKFGAVQDVIVHYDVFRGADVFAVEAPSGVADQPWSWDEIVQGAKNRALLAKSHGNLGVGIEAGLVKVPGSEGRYWNTTVVAVYDGTHYHLGTSTGFEVPQHMIHMMQQSKCDLDQAAKQAGISSESKIGATEGGLVSLFTNGRVSRKDQIAGALRMAFISIEQAHLYGKKD